MHAVTRGLHIAPAGCIVSRGNRRAMAGEREFGALPPDARRSRAAIRGRARYNRRYIRMSRHYFGPIAQGLSAPARAHMLARLNPESYAIPVYRGTGRDETLIGSGVLLAIGAAKFFCTAAHVFDALAKTPLVLHGEGPAHRVHAQPHVTQLPNSGRDDDKYDLLIDRFGEDRARWFSDSRFITVSQIEQNEFPNSRKLLYLFAGYPASANRPRRTQSVPNLATYLDSPFGPETYDTLGFVPNLHLITGFNAKQMWNEAGEVVTPTKPEGISGGPVWRVGHVIDVERGRYGPKFVAIGLEYRKDAFIALRLSFVLETIRSLHSDVSYAIPRAEWIGVNVTTSP